MAAKQRESEGRDPHIAQRLQKKVTKRVQFLENVASSKRQASLAVQGGLKKKRKKDRVGKRLGDLSQLAASLSEAAHLVRPAPSSLTAHPFLHWSSEAQTRQAHCVRLNLAQLWLPPIVSTMRTAVMHTAENGHSVGTPQQEMFCRMRVKQP